MERINVCRHLQSLAESHIFETDLKAREFLKASLRHLFESDCANSNSENGNSSFTPTLDSYSEVYKMSVEEVDVIFPWDTVLADEKAIQEYINFLREPEIPFIPSDLELIAHLYAIPIRLLDYQFKPIKQQPSLPEEDATLLPLLILVDDSHDPFEYSRVTAIPARDCSKFHPQIIAILNELYNLPSAPEILSYLEGGQFGETEMVGEDPDSGSGQEDQQMRKLLIKEIIIPSMNYDNDITSGERVRLQVALMEIPKVCLHVICNRIEECGGNERFLGPLRLALDEMKESILANELGTDTALETILPYVWTMASYAPMEWMREMGIVKLEQVFAGVTSLDIEQWRMLFSGLPALLCRLLFRMVGRDDLEEEEDGGSGRTFPFGRRDKDEFMKYLQSITDKGLDLNKCDPKEILKLVNVSFKQWPLHLPKIYIFSILDSLPGALWDQGDNKKTQALYYLYSMYNLKPNLTISLLHELRLALTRGGGADSGGRLITQIISKFSGGWWDLREETLEGLRRSSSVEDWVEEMVSLQSILEEGKYNQRGLEETVKIIENDGNSTLSREEIHKVKELVEELDLFKIPEVEKLEKNLAREMTQWLQEFKKRMSYASMSDKIECLAYVNLAMQIKLKFRDGLRPSQKFAIVAALHLGHLEKSLLSQMATGEGKTCVVLAVAIVRGVFGQQTDIVTSSEVLARRDAEAYRSLYNLFNLTVGHVTSRFEEERRLQYKNDLVYGTSTCFQGDYVNDLFYKKGIRGNRPYENVIIDEVDAMLLDNGRGVVYLSHDPADVNTLESVFVYIWTNVVAAVNSCDYKAAEIHEKVMSAIYPTIQIEDISTFLRDPEKARDLWDWMIREQIVNEWGRILFDDKSKAEVILGKLPGYLQSRKRQLKYLLEKILDEKRPLEVMDRMKPLIDRNLYTWIENAFHATQFTEGVEYVVDIRDHSEDSLEDKEVHAKIIPVNLSTGVDQINTSWNDGLHQFLELKHGCKMGTLNLIGIFASGMTYFRLYKRKFGLTGTMGTPSDRKFLRDTYKVEYLSVPLAQAKRFVEEEPVKCNSEQKWKEEVYRDAHEKTLENGRTVLIICENVNKAAMLDAYFRSLGVDKESIQCYTRDKQEFGAVKDSEGVKPGQIIIATNLAGRGTDIRLSKELKEAGGLHVILSYLPTNLRVEQQALGRAARSGDPGSGKIIFQMWADHMDAIDLKILRDEEESRRVGSILEYYENVILKKEQMFGTFAKSYHALVDAMDEAYKRQNSDWGDMQSVILASMRDKWAFWLDGYTFYLEHRKDKDAVDMMNRGRTSNFLLDEEHLKKELMQMIGWFDSVKNSYEDEDRGLESKEERGLRVVDESGLMVKAAKIFIKRGIGFRGRFIKKEVEKALQYLNSVLEKERDLLPAMYYKLHCELRLGKWRSSEFEKLAGKVLKMLEEAHEKQLFNTSLVSQIKCILSEEIVRRQGYHAQKENEMRILGTYKGSIEKMIGNEKMCPSQEFGGIKEIRDSPEIVGNLERYLIRKGVLLETEFRFEIPDRSQALKQLAEQFWLEEEEVRLFLWRLNGTKLGDDTEKQLKKDLKMPYRGGFWNEIWNCLGSPQTFAVVKASESKGLEEGESCSEKNAFTDVWLPRISGPNDLKPLTMKPIVVTKYGLSAASSRQMESVTMGAKSAFMNEQKFRHLRSEGRLCYETAAVLNLESLKNLKLKDFCRITPWSFRDIPDISGTDSQKIYKILQDSNIIDASGELLSTEWGKDGENKLDFTEEYEVFRGDILAILQSSCRYKYELLSLIQQVEEAEAEIDDSESGNEKKDHRKEEELPFIEVKFSLPNNPWKEFLTAAIDLGFVKGLRPSPSFFRDQGGIKFFEEPEKWAKWIGGKIGVSLPNPLVDKNEDRGPSLELSELKELFPNESDLFLGNLRENVSGQKWLLLGDKDIPPDMKSKYEFYLPETMKLAKWKVAEAKGKLLKEALKVCNESRGKLHLLDNPDAELNPLEDYFGNTETEQKTYQDEIALFKMSSFDHVIDTVERKYTWKMIFSAFAVFLLGIVQVVIGVVINFFSMGAATFIGSGFIQEGIGDMIYSAMSFWSGRFSWQEYINNKWQSVAITVATMGIASLISKVRYSKYGARLFGAKGASMSGRMVQESLKQGAKGGVRRSVWKMLAKSAAYKVLQSGAIAGGTMVVSYGYEKVLSEAVNNLVQGIFSKIYAKAHDSVDRRLRDDLHLLCDQTGSTYEASKVLTGCLKNALLDSRYFNAENIVRNLATIQRVAWGGIAEATGKVVSAGKMSGQTAALIRMAGKITSGVMTVSQVASSLDNLETQVDKLIGGMQEELEKSMEGMNASGETGGVSMEEKRKFVEQVKKEIDRVLTQVLEDIMRTQVIEPLMNMGCQKLLTGIGRFIRGAYMEFRDGRIRKEIRKTVNRRNNPNMSSDERSKLNTKLIQLCSKSRNPETVALAVEHGIPLGNESLQVLANAYNVRIVVKSGNDAVSDVIEPECGRGKPKATLNLKHSPPTGNGDLGHWESSTGAGGGASSNFNNADCLLQAFNEELRTKCPSDRGTCRTELARHMRRDPAFRDYVKSGYHHTYFACGGFGGARRAPLYTVRSIELDGDERDRTKEETMRYKEELRREGRLETVEEGPVKEKAMTKLRNKNGEEKDVLLLQCGEVRPEHLRQDLLPPRPGPDVTNTVLEDQDADSCDQAGHNTPQSQRGPPTASNLYPQHPDLNMGVDNALNRQANRFLRDFDRQGRNPSVRYIIRPVRNDPESLRPTETIIHHEYLLNGDLYRERSFRMPNPRARRIDTEHPPRRQFLRRNRGL